MDILSQPNPSLWLTLVSVLLLSMGLALLVLWLKLRRLGQQQRQQTEVFKSDMRALVSAAIGVGERVHRIEKSLKEVSHRQEVIDQTDPGAQAYQQAIKMAQKGSSIEELIDICGLTRGEAELIAMLHRMERSF
ncbi:MAG: DUF2802 domain-containing protein [Gammaproteobacteria bacterium]|nr:DUF2802 domain-containing protein [Gammaproteobacteria bacterium]